LNTSTRKTSRAHRAFTLLELVLVMVILCTALAVVAPSFTGFRRGAELRDAGDQFIALTRYARTQSAATGTTYRMQIDDGAGTYQLLVQNGEKFDALGTNWGRTFTLPEGAKISMSKNASTMTSMTAAPQPQGASSSAKTIDFFATGRTEPATITITSARGDSLQITCPSPAEGFIVAPTKSGAR
jgi:type II secretion system protein H